MPQLTCFTLSPGVRWGLDPLARCFNSLASNRLGGDGGDMQDQVHPNFPQRAVWSRPSYIRTWAPR